MGRGLSREGIVTVALSLLDEVGLEGLTLRGVAGRLGVQAPALYWHVHNKRDLIDEMATQMWREILDELGEAADRPWPELMRSFAMITRRRLLSRRDGARVFSGTYLTDPDLIRRQEQPIQRLLAAGFTLQTVVRAQSLLYSFTIGFVVEEQSVAQMAATGDSRFDLAARDRRIGAEEFPLVAGMGPELFENTEARFALLVDVIIDAADRMRAR